MKKPNIDPRAIREFFVHHVEKFVFFGMLLALMVFAYGAVGREKLPFSPGDLQRATESAKATILERQPESKLESTNFIEVAKRVKIPIDKTPYIHSSQWNPPLFPSKGLREQPAVLPIEEVRGEAGFGPVSMKVGKAGAVRRRGTQGQRWVVLTGVIPWEKQQLVFREAFVDAQHRNEKGDIPIWVYFSVERAEVNGVDDLSPPKWFGMNEIFAFDMQKRWNNTAREVVDERFIYSVRTGKILMAFPLPPLVGRKWDRSAAHPPQIPLESTERAMRDKLDEMELGDEGEPDPSNEDPFAEDDEPMLLDNIGGGEDEMGFMPEGSAMMDGGDMEDGFFEEEGRGRMNRGRGEMEVSPYRLFRFFDYFVEPGKFYRYRVRPLLLNPNYNMADQHLAELTSKVGRTIPADPSEAWCDPTDVIAVPRDARVLAGPATHSLNPNTKPKIEVGIPFFHMPTGSTEFDTFEAVRGQRLNFPKRPLTSTTEIASADTTEETVDFITDHTIMDFRGGRRLPGRSKMTEPSLLLVLDPFGNLGVVSEVESLKEYRELKDVEPDKGSKSKDPGESFFPEEGMMEGYEGNMGDLFE